MALSDVILLFAHVRDGYMGLYVFAQKFCADFGQGRFHIVLEYSGLDVVQDASCGVE